MKITDIRIHVLKSPLAEPFAFSQGWVKQRSATLIEVLTDEGISGWGESFAQGLEPPEIAATVIDKALKPLVMGADPLDIEVLWHRMYHRTRDYGRKGSVIAAISGAAVAGGMELALWCDLRVVEADAYFGVYCRRFGVPLIDGGTVRLPRLIGMGHAMDLILTGRQVEAAEALQMGLANRVVPTGQAREAAIALAQQLAAFPQATMRADRESAYAQGDLALGDALQQEWQRGKARIPDALEGATRFAQGQGRHGRF